MKNKISFGLLLLTATLLIAGATTVNAYPTQTVTCNNCHAYPPTSINVVANITSVTIAPGQSFNVLVSWSGGATDGQTAAKWPSGVSNNALFNPNPVMSVAGVTPSGSMVSTLTAPTTPGTYALRVYASTGGSLFETSYQNIAVTVQAPPTPVLTTITVSPATATVIQGNTQAFTGATLDQFGKPIVATVTWSSSNTTVGTVSSTGVLTGVSAEFARAAFMAGRSSG